MIWWFCLCLARLSFLAKQNIGLMICPGSLRAVPRQVGWVPRWVGLEKQNIALSIANHLLSNRFTVNLWNCATAPHAVIHPWTTASRLGSGKVRGRQLNFVSIAKSVHIGIYILFLPPLHLREYTICNTCRIMCAWMHVSSMVPPTPGCPNIRPKTRPWISFHFLPEFIANRVCP